MILAKTCGEGAPFQCFNGGVCNLTTNSCEQCDPGWMHNRAGLKLNDCTQSIHACIVLSAVLSVGCFFVGCQCLLGAKKYRSLRQQLLLLNGVANIFGSAVIIAHALSNFEISIPVSLLTLVPLNCYCIVVHLAAKSKINPIYAVAKQSSAKLENISLFWNIGCMIHNCIIASLQIYAVVIKDDIFFNYVVLVGAFTGAILVNINIFGLRFAAKKLIMIIRENNKKLSEISSNHAEMDKFLLRLEKSHKDFLFSLPMIAILITWAPILYVALGTIPYIWFQHYIGPLIWMIWGNNYYKYCAGYKETLPPGYNNSKSGPDSTKPSSKTEIRPTSTNNSNHQVVAVMPPSSSSKIGIDSDD